MSDIAQDTYRALVYQTPGFETYFFAATPIREVAELNIGSRPASRKATQRIEDLRAIPWGFSWAQGRLLLPGCAGDGAAQQQYVRRGGQDAPATQAARLAQLRDMYQHWPFFRTLLSNMAQVLAKTDLAIARQYAELVDDAAIREPIFARLSD